MNKLRAGLLLSLGISVFTVSSTLPARGSEKVDCGENANVQVVNGVIVCTVEKKVIKQATCNPDNKRLERIPVYYTDPTLLKEVLDKVGVPCGSIVGVDTSPPALKVLGSSKDNSTDPSETIDTYKRRIADLDRPLERVNMEMWGIQISSADSSRLASVMDQVNSEINHTRKAMERAYHGLTSLARVIAVADESERDLEDYNFRQLSSQTGPTGYQRISLPDVLARINLACKATPQSQHYAENCNARGLPGKPRSQINVYNEAANNLCNLFADQEDVGTADLFSRYNQFAGSLSPFRRPFQRFQEVALHQRYPITSQHKCNDGNIVGDDRKAEVIDEWGRRQSAVLDFLRQYNNSQRFPDQFDPASLTTAASQLDGLLSPIADALNQDIEEFFIRPTLHRIKKIVGQYRNVEYAEVGRTTLSGLNGLLSTVSSTISTSFDEPTPLRLNSLIETAGKLQPDVDKLFPTLQNVPLSVGNQINASSAVSLLAALSKEEVRWRSMSSGVTLKIIPTVLRDRTAAQLLVDLIIADPAATNVSTSKDNPLRTLSRVSNSTLQTKVRVNTMDLFALSSFNNQTTVNGRRWYVPLIGPIWEGIFGDIPVVGNLFSPLRPPIDIQHQSIILTNTLIVPTAMGLTEWYSPELYSQGSVKATSRGSLRSLSACRSGARLDQFICINGQWERN
jgi:hypothetical protein